MTGCCPMPPRRPTVRLSFLVPSLLALGATVHAGPNKGASVFIPASAEARQALERTKRLADQDEYVAAARLQQSLLAQHDHTLISQADGIYCDLAEAVRQQRTAWPQAARVAVRTALTEQASAAFDAVSETSTLRGRLRFTAQWPYTDAANQVLTRIENELRDQGRSLALAYLNAPPAAHQKLSPAPRTKPARKMQRPATESEVLWSWPRDPSVVCPDSCPPACRHRRIHTGPLHSPACHDSRLFVQDRRHDSLWCLSLYGGRLLWQFPARDAKPCAACDLLLAPEVSGVLVHTRCAIDRPELQTQTTLRMLSAEDGHTRWEHSLEELLAPMARGSNTPAVRPHEPGSWCWYDRGIVVTLVTRTPWGAWELHLVRIEPDGRIAWRRHLGSSHQASPSATVPDELAPPRVWCQPAVQPGIIEVYSPGVLNAFVASLTGGVLRLTHPPDHAIPKPAPMTTRRPHATDTVLNHPPLKIIAGNQTVTARTLGPAPSALLEARAMTADTPDAWLDLAAYLLTNGITPARAVAILSRVLRESPRHAQQVFQQAIQSANAPAVIDALLTLTRRCAPSTVDALCYRFVFAEAFMDQNRPKDSVALFQEILDDETLRRFRIQTHQWFPTAGRLAAERMRSLISDADGTLAKPLQTQAQRAWHKARRSLDPTRMRSVFERYPITDAAASAQKAWVASYERAGRLNDTAETLLDAIHGPIPIDPAWAMRQLAACNAINFDTLEAQRWHDRARRAATNPTPAAPPATAAWEPPHFDASDDEPRPALAFPPPWRVKWHQDWPTDARLIGPVPTSPLLRYDPGRLRALDPATGDTLWEQSWPAERMPTLTGGRAGLLLLTTPYRVLALDENDGTVRWSIDPPTPSDSPLTDPEFLDPVLHDETRTGRLVRFHEKGGIKAYAPDRGELVWADPHGAPVATITSSDLHLITAWQSDVASGFGIHDMFDGKRVLTARLSDGEPIEALAITLRDEVLAVTNGTLRCYAMHHETLRWACPLPSKAVAHLRILDANTAAIVAPDGRLTVVNLDEGRVRWGSPAFTRPDTRVVGLHARRDRVLRADTRELSAFDRRDGRPAWTWTPPANARIEQICPGESHLLAITSPAPTGDALLTANLRTAWLVHADTGRPSSPRPCKLGTNVANIAPIRLAPNRAGLAVRHAKGLTVWQPAVESAPEPSAIPR